jgi:endonuclease G
MALLSNWHVLADSSFAAIGDEIVQPGARDRGVLPADRIATLARVLLDVDGDAAIATVTGDRPVDPSILELPKPVTSIGLPNVGDIVVKSGRSTSVTRGRVESFGRYFPVYRTRGRVGIDGFKIVTVTEGNPLNEEISGPGDSGAAWILENTGTMVGLNFAGERDPDPRKEEALACFATRVFSRLSIAPLG